MRIDHKGTQKEKSRGEVKRQIKQDVLVDKIKNGSVSDLRDYFNDNVKSMDEVRASLLSIALLLRDLQENK